MLHKMLIIRAPSSIQVAYKLMYPFLSKQTRDKIEFVSGDWKTRVLELIDRNQLPKYWGGTQTLEGSVYGNVKLSRKLPLELRYVLLWKGSTAVLGLFAHAARPRFP